MKKWIWIIIAAVIAAGGAVAVLMYLGIIGPGKGKSSQSYKNNAAAYINYMDMYVLLNDKRVVTGSLSEKPEEDIPELTGLSFGQVIVGEELVTDDKVRFDYAMVVVKALKEYAVDNIREVYVSADCEVTLYTGNIKILLGKNDKTPEKIKDLRDLYSQVADLSGTLNLQEVNDGYTFKVSH